MAAVWLRVRRSLRQRRAAVLVVGTALGVVLAVVLTLAAGARRTATAPDRFTAAAGGEVQATITQEDGPPRTAEVAGLPSVGDVDGITFVFGSLLRADGSELQDALTFSGSRERTSTLVSGRLPDPAEVSEFVASEGFAERYGVHVGDTFSFISWTQEQLGAGQAFTTAPAGPTFKATLVGLIRVGDQLEDQYSVALFPPGLLDRGPAIVSTVMTVRLAPGATLADLRAQLDGLPGGASLRLEAGRLVGDAPRRTVAAQATGLWILAGVAAVASLLAMGQLLARHARVSEHERQLLLAIGATHADVRAETALRAAAPAALGVVVAVAVAAAASGIFPLGFARKVEPERGLHPDPLLLLGGAVVLFAALVGWVAVTANGRRRRRASLAADRVARRVPGGAAATGVRFALGTSSRASGSVGATIGLLAAVVAGLAGAAAFGASVQRLVTDPARFGQDYDVSIGDGLQRSAGELRAAFEADPDVAGLSVLTGGQARRGGTTIEVAGVERVRGEVVPRVLQGRNATGPDEVALGLVEARRLGVGVGDELTLTGDAAQRTYRVVGIVVVPSVGGSEAVGEGAAMTAEGLAAIAGDSLAASAAIDLRRGAPDGTIDRIARLVGGQGSLGESVPGVVLNLSRIRGIPAALVGVFALLAVVTLLHGLVVSFQSRRFDVAVLRALGAGGGWVTRAVHWQATVLVLAPVAIGVPVGLVAGTSLFRAMAARLGVVPDPTYPLGLLALAGAAAVVLANVVAVVPAVRARHLRTVTQLRPE